MNSTTRYLFALGLMVLLILSGVAGFNYYVDPMCYYHCPDVDLTKRTENVYYQGAQTAVANPDAEVLILGSSRGETVPPKWIESVTGMKTVNLSRAGADVLLKVALLNAALDNGAKVKKVIWIADYFELSKRSTDIKTRITPALLKYYSINKKEEPLSYYLDHLQRLIDHNSFEASLELLKNKSTSMFEKEGAGSQIDYSACLSPDFVGSTPSSDLAKNVLHSYNGFSVRLISEIDPDYWDLFVKQISMLSGKGIEVVILIPPFHPDFVKRFKVEHLEQYPAWGRWVRRIEEVSSERNIKVINFFDGIPGDDEGPSFWNDGVHISCKGMMIILKEAIK